MSLNILLVFICFDRIHTSQRTDRNIPHKINTSSIFLLWLADVLERTDR